MIIDADNGIARIFSFRTDNLPRWALRVDGTETGSNVGGDFTIRRYNDTGAFVDAPLLITRSTGQSTFSKKVVIENNSGDQQLQIVSTTAPSIRLDNIQIGATKRAGLGISTATNNFIQGSADRDFCMFNGSTTASPILFGIYDTTNVAEAARISASRNFIVGKVVDSGERLQIAGNSLFSSTSGTLIKLQGSSTGNNTVNLAGANFAGDNFELGVANLGYLNSSYPGILAGGGYLYGTNSLGIIAQNGSILFQTSTGTSSVRMSIKNNGVINLSNLPTSATGLSSGDLYRTANIVNIVP